MACETIPNGMEAELLLDILETDGQRWAWISFCCGDGGHLWDGTPIEEMRRYAIELRASLRSGSIARHRVWSPA